MNLDALVNDLAELLLAHEEINLQLEAVLRIGAIDKAEILRDRAVKDHSAHGGIDQAIYLLAVHHGLAAHFDLGVQADHLGVICHDSLVKIAEHLALAGLAVLVKRQIIGTEHHVLRRNRHRASVRRFEQVAGRQHQETGLSLGLGGKRHVHSHLVAVEVGVVRGAGQRMQLQGRGPPQAPAQTPGCPDGAASARG